MAVARSCLYLRVTDLIIFFRVRERFIIINSCIENKNVYPGSLVPITENIIFHRKALVSFLSNIV